MVEGKYGVFLRKLEEKFLLTSAMILRYLEDKGFMHKMG